MFITSSKPAKSSDSFSDYSIDYLLAESDRSYYATVDDLNTKSSLIPKSVVDKDYRIKSWYIEQFKKGKITWNKKGKKEIQTTLTEFTSSSN